MRFNEIVGGRQRAEGRRRARGFTLIELMITVVILGLLAGIVAYSYSRYLDRAKQQKARIDISNFVSALDLYNGDKGHFPENQDGLKVLVPDYIKSLPLDPWGRAYQYVQPGREGPFDIICYGADGREGGSGADQDITNHDKDIPAPKK